MMHICSRCDESKSVGDAPLAPTIWLGVRTVSFRPESSDRMGQSSSLQHNTTHKRIIISLWVRSMRHRLSCWYEFPFLLIISNCRIMIQKKEEEERSASRSLSFFCVRYICVSTFSGCSGIERLLCRCLAFFSCVKDREVNNRRLFACQKGKEKDPPFPSTRFVVHSCIVISRSSS